MPRPTYIAYDARGRVIANHLNSWVNLAQGVSESHPGDPFSISTRDGRLVYSFEPCRESVRVSIERACAEIDADMSSEAAA